MSIKHHFVRLAEKIHGRKCSSCAHNNGGRCCHTNGETFCRCWQSITRPGFKERASCPKGPFRFGEEETNTQVTDGLTEEEKHHLGKIVESLQEASTTAQDAGLLGETEHRPIWEDKTESGLLEEE